MARTELATIGYDRKLIERITSVSGKPATTASTALLEAMRELKVSKITFGAPWGKAVNVSSVKFLEENGIKVLHDDCLGVVRNQEIGLLDPETAIEMARKIDRPDADAIMLGCGNWRAAECVDRLEKELGKPVLTTNGVSLWHSLKMIGAAPYAGYGRLIEHHLQVPGAQRRAG